MTSKQEKLTKIIEAGILEPEFGHKRIIKTAYDSIGSMCGYQSLSEFKADLEKLNRTGRIQTTRIDLISALSEDLQNACHESNLTSGNNAIVVK